jgi:hypothetical protein
MMKHTKRTPSPQRTNPKGRPLAMTCVGALLPLMVTMGCSASDGTKDGSGAESDTAAAVKTLDAAFVARAEKVCRPYSKYNSTHFFAFTHFNRFDPSAGVLKRVGDFLSRNPSYRTLASDLQGLGQPETGKAGWSTVMEDLGTSQKLMKNNIQSAQQGDVAAFKTYDERLTANISGLHADLVKLGLPSGSACYGVQGDPLQQAPRSE